jgi:hypothetical protein
MLGFVAIAFIAFIVTRFWKDSDQRAIEEVIIYDDLEGQIRSMLCQSGVPLTQGTIRDQLGIPVEEVARTISELEKKGLVTRKWLPMDYISIGTIVHVNTDVNVSIDIGEGRTNVAPLSFSLKRNELHCVRYCSMQSFLRATRFLPIYQPAFQSRHK